LLLDIKLLVIPACSRNDIITSKPPFDLTSVKQFSRATTSTQIQNSNSPCQQSKRQHDTYWMRPWKFKIWITTLNSSPLSTLRHFVPNWLGTTTITFRYPQISINISALHPTVPLPFISRHTHTSPRVSRAPKAYPSTKFFGPGCREHFQPYIGTRWLLSWNK
jgi:hypothetical protein